MPTARRLLIDSSRSTVAHCISRCVRRAFLLGEGCDHRRSMLRARMRTLSEIFAVDVLVFVLNGADQMGDGELVPTET